ncbi:MAG: hypothetical protein FJW96_08680 [Actinobacteria bacterium]|nr:hypothetical protein [Actinomycetota bacterium]
MTSIEAIAPITRTISVRCDTETAFRVFTHEVATWWPLETHALHPGAVREVVWEEQVGGEVYEISTGGERAHWADVTAWDPPHRLAIAWKVNPEALAATDVEVTFTPEGDGTRVDLVHSGWERLGDTAAETRGNDDGGWVTVLGRYEAALDR